MALPMRRQYLVAGQVVDQAMAVETHYARSGDLRIAYQVIGNGPFDLVFVPGFISNLDHYWDEPTFVHFISRLSSFSRLILFDKRGTGLSDRLGTLPTLEERMDDVRAVMDAVGQQARRSVRNFGRRRDEHAFCGDLP